MRKTSLLFYNEEHNDHFVSLCACKMNAYLHKIFLLLIPTIQGRKFEYCKGRWFSSLLRLYPLMAAEQMSELV